MVLVVALILAAGGVGWWYIRQLNPEVRRVTQRASRSTPPTRSTRSASVSSRTASSSTPVSSRWYVERHGGLEITPGYYEIRDE